MKINSEDFCVREGKKVKLKKWPSLDESGAILGAKPSAG